MALMRRKNNRKLASADVEGGHQQTERDHTSTQLQGRGWTLGTLGKSVFVCIIILCLLAYHSLRTSPVDREKLEKQRLYEERQREAERNRLAPGSPDDPVWENGHYVHNHKYNKEQYTISSTDDDGDDAKITVVDSPDIKRIKRKRSDVLERRLRRGNVRLYV